MANMYIPNKTYKDKGMSVYYDEIKEAQRRLSKKIIARELALKTAIDKFVVAYGSVLDVPGNPSFTGKEKLSDSVKVGVIENGTFKETQVSDLVMNNDRRINFCLCTVIDDVTEGGVKTYPIGISTRVYCNVLYFSVGEDSEEISVLFPEDLNAYYNVCVAVKDVIMRSLTDPRLD